ncbi:class I SAM-dependent methyltransferase [Belnapia sp. T6]|uniref:Class I SAM-dependent methyltransferase n=1 Tax=Belnapia mucosa TaxID=2804532 RepID=A0ABS1VB82_9PROT|nr:class I SAM-dependent methyltransferase [Belnapia mucosa]MBL6457598.1 class I SAM-dependent methyltransferase [Belnapia mucosa]
MAPTPPCAVCGSTDYFDRAILPPEQVEGWGLTPAEHRLVDLQQGRTCRGCGGNLRSLALADAVMAECGWTGTLREFVVSDLARPIRLLEVNEAGSLSPELRRMPGHRFGAYPEVDMQAIPFADHSFDLVIHSDTLEHVPDPGRALMECARVLTADGALCFTVPALATRLSVSRADLTPLYHGDPAHKTEDMRVHTDFGADIWQILHAAGFAAVCISRFDDAIAITATKLLRRRKREVTMADIRTAEEEMLDAVLRSTSWRVTAPLRQVARLLRGERAPVPSPTLPSPALPGPARNSTGQPGGSELVAHLGSLAEWRGWAEAHAAEISPQAGADMVSKALSDGIDVPLFGRAGSNEVSLTTDDPREGLVARGTNARLRAVLLALSWHEGAHDIWNSRLYLHEAMTPFALLMRSRYPRLVGSEYAPDEAAAKSLWPVPAVDIMHSPFPDGSFDFVLTNEVLEHIPDLVAGLRDTLRILAPGGKLIGTCPFNFGAERTEIRARLTPSGIEHLAKPEYHGNPVDPEGGSLVFQVPGWDLLDLCREAGFSHASMVFIGSAQYGIVGRELAGNFVLLATR